MENKKIAVAFFLIVFAAFFLRGFVYLDPDFGYRLKAGELILSQGFPKTDPYSYTMPSFPYVEHAWLTAVFWNLSFPLVGKAGLSALSTFIALSALIISASKLVGKDNLKKLSKFTPSLKNLWYFGLIPFVLSIAVIMPFFGVRAQVMSWLMTAVLLVFIFNSSLWRKWRYGFPLFFLLWANLHGSFIAGLSVLVFVVLARAIRTKKLEASDILVIALSIFATFINPYGLGAYKEALASAGDISLRWNIAEWMPAIFLLDFSFISLLVLSVLLVYRYRKKFKIEEIGLYFIFLLQAILSIRNIPLWVLIAMPLTLKSLVFFYDDIKNIKDAIPRLKKFYLYGWIGTLLLLAFQGFFSLKEASSLSIDAFYPKGAVSYLSQNLPEGEIFSDYGWGGYLIWNLPEKKVFIDGRMPSWRREEFSPQESGDAFDEYNMILKGEANYKESFEKYNVDTVAWPRNEPKSFIGTIAEKLEGVFSEEAKTFNLIEQIEKDGWEKVYEDDISVIYTKP